MTPAEIELVQQRFARLAPISDNTLADVQSGPWPPPPNIPAAIAPAGMTMKQCVGVPSPAQDRHGFILAFHQPTSETELGFHERAPEPPISDTAHPGSSAAAASRRQSPARPCPEESPPRIPSCHLFSGYRRGRCNLHRTLDVFDRRDRQRNRNQAAVLTLPDGLKMVDPLATSDAR